jgi:hypothetical protein
MRGKSKRMCYESSPTKTNKKKERKKKIEYVIRAGAMA